VQCRRDGDRAPGRAPDRPSGRVDPAPLATINQPARTPRPTVAPADVMADGLRRRAGLRRGAEGRDGRDAPREPAFDLVERVPDRAAGLTSHGPKPSRNYPIFTICHTGNRNVSIPLTWRFKVPK